MGKSLLTKCLRCWGAVIYDKFYGSQEQFMGWKCLICGEIVDPVILESRQLMRAG
jgi:DNA-directed RNA polymerase subunit RPC12/RpoP